MNLANSDILQYMYSIIFILNELLIYLHQIQLTHTHTHTYTTQLNATQTNRTEFNPTQTNRTEPNPTQTNRTQPDPTLGVRRGWLDPYFFPEPGPDGIGTKKTGPAARYPTQPDQTQHSHPTRTPSIILC
jgi:hypothetical protein